MLLIGPALQLRFGEGKVALEMTIHHSREAADVVERDFSSAERRV
jgi:hypothetical protein